MGAGCLGEGGATVTGHSVSSRGSRNGPKLSSDCCTTMEHTENQRFVHFKQRNCTFCEYLNKSIILKVRILVSSLFFFNE